MQPADPPPATVPPRVLSKLALYTPPKELVDAYLGEIARSYGAPFEAAQPMEKLEDDQTAVAKSDDDEDGGGPGEGQEKEGVKALESESEPARGNSKKHEEVKKGNEAAGEPTTGMSEVPVTTEAAPPKKLTADEELAQRFERLKNLK